MLPHDSFVTERLRVERLRAADGEDI